MQLQRFDVPVASALRCPSWRARQQSPPLARPRALRPICRAGTPSSTAGFFSDPYSQSNMPLSSGTAPPNTEAGRAYWRTLWEGRTAVKSSHPPAAAAAEDEAVSNVSAAQRVEQVASPFDDPNTAERPAVGSRSSSAAVGSRGARGGSGQGEGQEDILIELRDVAKAFGNKIILSKASFKIRRGEAIGVIGGSGTGKSTTLRLMAGLLEPDSGQVIVKGVPRKGLLSDDAPATATSLRIGMVFQSGALFDSLTVGENVGFLLYEHSSLPRDTVRRLVAKALSQVGLSGVEDLYPSELSGGMKKRVALARAIIRDDEHDTTEQVIMYDEPTAGLDPVASTVVEDLIRSLHVKKDGNSKGGTAGGISAYIVVTHQHSTIRRSVDKLVFLHEGVVVWEGSVDAFETSEEPIVKQFRTGSLKGPIEYV